MLFLLILIALGSFLIPTQGLAQSDSYQFVPAPDVWFNSVDGVRIGARVRGRVRGTFKDGPHRLNAGVWLGTKIPENPVSYYFSFTEPIPSWSDFGSEASIALESLYRTGFQQHGIRFKKRWQPGFDELHYRELSLGFRTEHRFDKDYLLYNQLWQDEWLYLASLNLLVTDENGLGPYLLSLSSDANIAGDYDNFIRGEVSLEQKISLSDYFELSGRVYSGFATKQTTPEYLFSHSLQSARSWMESGLTRARGTIPPAWIESGTIQVSGGANLRGYLHQDIEVLNNDAAPLYTSLSSLNIELEYPNPLNKAIDKIPVLGDLVSLKSYLFYDGGTSLGVTNFEEHRTLADAGPGFLFSIDIPDYLGKSRGLMIRYDLPLWLSDPGSEKSFKFRNIIGLGAVISL